MANEHVIAPIREMLDSLLADKPEYFVVDIKIKPTNNIKVFVDADNGASIDKLVSLNRQLYPLLEAAGLFPADDFSLEVSSPGLDEPVMLQNGTVLEGKLLSFNETELVLEEMVGKKKEVKETNINLSEIKHTKVCIVF
jgi:ribosome maturation factor RimP